MVNVFSGITGIEYFILPLLSVYFPRIRKFSDGVYCSLNEPSPIKST